VKAPEKILQFGTEVKAVQDLADRKLPCGFRGKGRMGEPNFCIAATPKFGTTLQVVEQQLQVCLAVDQGVAMVRERDGYAAVTGESAANQTEGRPASHFATLRD
jgi:hypothetical protein